jgi:RES domain-containing protein
VADEPDRIPVVGIWYRHVLAGGDPLRLAAGDARGRWQRSPVVGALYLADTPDTAWAEFYRAAAELEVPPGKLLPRDLWRYQVSLDAVADLSSNQALAAVRLSPPLPDSGDWPSFQAVGEHLALGGAQGVLWRSAARPANLCVCVFAVAVSTLTPLDRERIDTPPAPPRGMRT